MKYSRMHFLLVILLSIFVFACSKDNENPSAKTPEEILTANAWKANELRAIENNTPLYYKRGSSTNTSNYNLDNESILFKADHTGTYFGSDGGQYSFTWNFSNPEKSKLTWVVQFGPATTINWDIISLTESRIDYNEYYTAGSISTQTFGNRIPK